MQLVVLTPEVSVEGETDMVNVLFQMGMPRLHLRKPGFGILENTAYLNAIDPEFHSRIVIHNSFQLFAEYGLGGIHLNALALEDQEIWKKLEDIDRNCISTSFHSWQEIRDNDIPYGYVFISPVFNSISKQGYKAAINLDEEISTRNYLQKHGKVLPHIFGLGGVDQTNVDTLKKKGFDGAAVLGGIWQSSDPVIAFKQIAEKIIEQK